MGRTLAIFMILICLIVACQNMALNNGSFEEPGWKSEYFQATEVYNLCQAIANDDITTVSRILNDKTIDVNTRDTYHGNTVLMYAVVYEKYEAAKLLLQHGANPNLTDNYYKETPLILAINNRSSFSSDVSDCDTKMIQLLIDHGANVNYRQTFKYKMDNGGINSQNSTVLDIACRNGCLNIVKLLVDKGADVNAENESVKNSAIESAMYHNHLTILKYLIIDKKAHVPSIILVRPKNGNLPEEKLSLEEFLLEHALDSTSKNFKIRQEIINYCSKKVYNK